MERLSILFAAAFLLTGCGAEQYSSGPNVSSTNTAPSLEELQKSLQGTWSRPCQYDSTSHYYYIESMELNGTDSGFGIITQDSYYQDSGCASLLILRSQTLDVSDMQANGGAWTFTATISNQTYEPMTPASATNTSAKGLCEINSWNSGVTLNTTSTPCNAIGTVADTIALIGGRLYRALDEIVNPNVLSGNMIQGAPYSKTH